VLTHFRLGVFAAATLGAVWAGQAFAFWPFGGSVTRLSLTPAYGGVCEECDLSGRILAGAKMTDSAFSRANFSHAVLARANASRSDFEAANFAAADLSYAVFHEANLTGANLDRANIAGADLAAARGLTQAQVDSACGDARTHLPPGLRVHVCPIVTAARPTPTR
jgi:hypothetical protein